MSDEHQVLSARVLSYLKRKSGKGIKPTGGETKAALTALTLLSVAYPNFANDPVKMFAKLVQASRSSTAPHQSSVTELTQSEFLRMQATMDKRALMLEMMASIMKSQSDVSKSIINNIR